MKNIDVKVAVHKAALKLNAKESVEQFTRTLSDEVKKWVTKKLNWLNNKDSSVYLLEVFPDKVVAGAYNHSGTPSDQYYMFTYTRDKNGAFSFGPLTEVVKKISYEPKAGVAITKNIETIDVEDPNEMWLWERKKPLWTGIV